ncbi:MAG: tellurium resistance protein TerC, partial [Pseudomonadota bacterium]
FIMYTAMKEIAHMLALTHLSADVEKRGQKSAFEVLVLIVIMNLIFSFDSILSAIAITDNFLLLSLAIVTSGVMMLLLAERVTEFISKNRMYEVLGLFILLLVGVLLLSEGGHKAELTLFGHEIEALSKTTFYFSVVVMVLLDLAQSRYKRKLLAEKRVELQRKI